MQREKQRVQDTKKVEKLVEELTLFDDELMSACFDNNIPAAETMLRTILNRKDIHVISGRGQVELKNPVVGGRNIRLDILIEDAMGRLMRDFHCRRVEEMQILELARSVSHFKEEGGKKQMSEAVEAYAREYAEEVAEEVTKEMTFNMVKGMLQKQLDYQMISEITKLSIGQVKEIEQELLIGQNR